MSNEDPIRRTTLPPLDRDGLRHWSSAAPDATAASDTEMLVATLADTMRNFVDKLPDMIERMVENRMQASQNEMRALIAESIGTLRGELKGCLVGIRDSIDPNARRKDAFRFAGERAEDNNEPLDLPDWRVGRTVLN
jgi:hypothetical protein